MEEGGPKQNSKILQGKMSTNRCGRNEKIQSLLNHNHYFIVPSVVIDSDEYDQRVLKPLEKRC